jgi:hypothetical protein
VFDKSVDIANLIGRQARSAVPIAHAANQHPCSRAAGDPTFLSLRIAPRRAAANAR